jgi:hypothetical protein
LYYQWRENHCHGTTTRHFVNNLIVESIGDDGVWRYASHALAPVFARDIAPLSMSITPEFLTAAQRRRDREIAN